MLSYTIYLIVSNAHYCQMSPALHCQFLRPASVDSMIFNPLQSQSSTVFGNAGRDICFINNMNYCKRSKVKRAILIMSDFRPRYRFNSTHGYLI